MNSPILFTALSTQTLRDRLADLNLEIDRLNHEINQKENIGEPVHDLEKKLEELEAQKRELVGRMQDRWSA